MPSGSMSAIFWIGAHRPTTLRITPGSVLVAAGAVGERGVLGVGDIDGAAGRDGDTAALDKRIRAQIELCGGGDAAIAQRTGRSGARNRSERATGGGGGGRIA